MEGRRAVGSSKGGRFGYVLAEGKKEPLEGKHLVSFRQRKGTGEEGLWEKLHLPVFGERFQGEKI